MAAIIQPRGLDMREKLLAILLALGLALSPFSVSAQTSDFKATQAAAENGDAEAQYSLGNMYAKGDGVDKDDVMAFKYYQLAADQGLAKAQRNLGVMYALGCGVAKNDVMAVKYMQLAADQGLAAAQVRLGFMYKYWRWGG